MVRRSEESLDAAGLRRRARRESKREYGVVKGRKVSCRRFGGRYTAMPITDSVGYTWTLTAALSALARHERHNRATSALARINVAELFGDVGRRLDVGPRVSRCASFDEDVATAGVFESIEQLAQYAKGRRHDATH